MRFSYNLSVLMLAGFIFAQGTVMPQHIRLTGGAAAEPDQLRVEVLETYPHSRGAFTQGLLYHEGWLYESSGRYNMSFLARVELETGEEDLRVDLAPQYFAEGLVLVGDELYQLTWREGKALVYDRGTFTRTNEFEYEGEGWGLAFDGTHLIMSDGSARLTFRDPETFLPVRRVTVRMNGEPLTRLNEMQYVDGAIYANVWMQDYIYKIDPRSGNVRAVIDATELLTPEEAQGVDVLNGVAYDPETDTFFITGKLWPKLFRVQFVPVEEEAPDAEPERGGAEE